MTDYLVIGSGRWATHLKSTLRLAGCESSQWSRRSNNELELQQGLSRASHVWLAISDSALPEWSVKLRDFKGLKLHSSGVAEIPGLHSVHPLMSFAPQLYPDDFYQRFALVSTSSLERDELIPGLKNPFFKIKSEQKAFYHSLCVLAGNGGVLLWNKFFSEMQRLGLPFEVTQLYASRILENLLLDPERALTGPLVRGDHDTLQKDLAALGGDPFQAVLQSLIHAFQKSQRGPL